ncbi:DUF5615 family PIN-like protein [Rubrivirga sp. IMCC43871]|uniref:DUF5615 family PIN-like protein n=1 Tax=Rubrivirga sp. IMCC43871 TaxID=3391575 RepID=UPI00399035BE
MLLFDHDLSWRLAARLVDVFPGSVAVSQVGLDRADDLEVWHHAKEHGLIVVAKDADLLDIAVLRGPPPHLVRIARGNCSTAEIEEVLRDAADAILALPGSQTAVLTLN